MGEEKITLWRVPDGRVIHTPDGLRGGLEWAWELSGPTGELLQGGLVFADDVVVATQALANVHSMMEIGHRDAEGIALIHDAMYAPKRST